MDASARSSRGWAAVALAFIVVRSGGSDGPPGERRQRSVGRETGAHGDLATRGGPLPQLAVGLAALGKGGPDEVGQRGLFRVCLAGDLDVA